MRSTRAATIFMALAVLAACDKARELPGTREPSVQVPAGDPTGGSGGAMVAVNPGDCTRCHGTPGLANDNADPLVAGAPPRAVTGNLADPVIGAHRAHLVNGTFRNAIECASCHVVPTSFPHPAQRQGKVSFSRLATTSWSGAPLVPTWNGTTCASTYCHGKFTNGNTGNTPSWAGGAVQCGSCHGIPPGGSHVQDAPGAPLDCGTCHTGYTRTVVNLALHVNGRLDVIGGGHPAGWSDPSQHGLAALGGLDACATCHTGYGPAVGAGSSCDGCHADPGTYGPYASGTYPPHPSWKTECTFCHGGRDSTSGAPPRNTHVISSDTTTPQATTDATIGAHTSHVGTAASSPASLHGIATGLDCTSCHQTLWASALDPGHVDKATADVHFNPVGATANPGAYTRPSCTANYCHGNFRGGAGTGAVSWTGTFGGALTLSCASCHGAPPATSATVPHPPNPTCASCHGGYTATTVSAATHVDGTVQHTPATGCTQCHGDLTTSGVANTDVRAAPGGNANAVDAHGNAASATTARGVGTHAKHLTGTAWRSTPIACLECHAAVATGDTSHATGTPALTFGTLARTAWSGQPAITPVWNGAGGATTLTCSSTYCHGAFKNGANATPTWTAAGTVSCGSCHGNGTSPLPGGTHPNNTACGSCHDAAYSWNGTTGTVNATQHLNGQLDLPNQDCTSCHGTAGRVAVAGVPSAANIPVYPPVSATGSTVTAGAHTAHVNQLGGSQVRNPMACAECHVVPTSTSHQSGTIDMTFGALARTGGVTIAFAASAGTTASSCANYCHGRWTGAFAAYGLNASIAWTAAATTCTSCHASPPMPSATVPHPPNPNCASCHGAGYATTGITGAALGTHVDGAVQVPSGGCTACHGDLSVVAALNSDVRAAPAGDANAVDAHGNAATATGQRGVGTHGKHLTSTTYRGTAIACSECHAVPAPGDKTHANGTAAVAFGTLARTAWTGQPAITPAYNTGTGGCSSTYCHGAFKNGANAAPTFTAAGSVGCTSCHGTAGTTPLPGGTHPANSACGTCHDGAYTWNGATGVGTVNASQHLNGVVDTPNQTCTSCHGTAGRTANAGTGTVDPNLAAAPPVDAAGSATGITVGVHPSHVNPTLAGQIFRPLICTDCHPNNAGNNAHSNGVVNLTLATIGGIGGSATNSAGTTPASCTTYCHGAKWPAGDAHQGARGTWAWNGANAGCGDCHADPPSNLGHAGVTAATSCGNCHPGYGATTVNLALHMNGQLDGGGEPTAGGTSCGSCHGTIWNAVNGTVAKVSKHSLLNDVPADDAAVWTGATLSGVAPSSRSCVNMCHGDHPHGLTSPVVATHENNVYLDATTPAARGGTTRTSATRDGSDFDAAATNGGLCASCHQKPVVAGGITVPKAAFDASAHDYTTNTVSAVTYTWTYGLHDGGLFVRDCTKCHASSVEGTTPSVTASGSATAAVHFSDNASLLAGTSRPAGTAAGFVCYNCHGTTATPAAGAQGNRSGKDIQSQIAHATTANQSGHPANSDTVHDSVAEFTNATFGNALGVAAGAGRRHASCLDCHDPHEAKPTSTNPRVVGSATNGNVAGPALQGAWGVRLSTNPAFWTAPGSGNFTKATLVAGTDLEATLCLKCHSSYYGALPTSPSGAFTETDVAREFNPGNAGNWFTTGTTTTWSSGETAGGFHPVLASVGSNLGATNNVKAPWTTTSLMTCSDCHESDTTTDPNGPHGSAARFILKGPQTTWNNTLVNGSSMPANAFCSNCHNTSWSTSRFTAHSRSDHFVACFNCHAAIPHGGPRPGILVAPAGAAAGVGGSIAGWDNAAPYFGLTAASGDKLYIQSYPSNRTNTWNQGNCGCNGTNH